MSTSGIRAVKRATTRVAPTIPTTAQKGLRLPGAASNPPGGGAGFFRADPSSTGAVCVPMGTQGKDACTCPLGDSRKNRPRAERRRSFWPFFLGVQEKGRKIINVYLYKEGSLRILLSFVFVDEPCNSHIFSERILKSFRFFIPCPTTCVLR